MRRRSQMELHEGDREQGVEQDDDDDPLDHGGGYPSPEAFDIAADEQPMAATGHRDQQCHDRGFAHAHPEMAHGDRVVQAVEEEDWAHIERGPADQYSARDSRYHP